MAKDEKNVVEKKEEMKLVPIEIMHPIKFDPEKEVEFASKCAKALTSIIDSKPKPVMINGEKYLEFEDWQTISRFFNTTVGTEKTERIVDEEGKFKGYSAVAVVFNPQGVKIGCAEASCFRDEKNWAEKPEFQLKSMAQTRACAKSLRNIFAWVVVLAGFKTTPAEELNDKNYEGKEPFPSKPREVKKPVAPKKMADLKLICTDCGNGITKPIKDFSEKNYGMALCMNCQTKYKKKL